MIAASKLPDTIASRYIPVRLIGKGGMGVVYEVVHARTGEHLALKVLQGSAGAPAEALERFKREARAPAQIKSENVVHVSDADVAPELDDAPFLVMELLDGMDLEQAASVTKPDPATVVGWLRQIAPALDKAHRLGIVHRDLKPENLFLATVEDRPPVVKILDFGIAKMAEEGTAATVSGQVLGTPKYMAPEQAARHPRITAATDRYALGLIAYRLLVGESYYRGDVMSILAELLHGAPSAPSARDPSLGEGFDAWFTKACHREPEQRFISASKQVEALAEALGLPSDSGDAHGERSSSSPSLDTELTLPESALSHRSLLRRPSSRRALAAAALLLVVVAAVLVYRGSTSDEPRPASELSAATAGLASPALTSPAAPALIPATETTATVMKPSPEISAAATASARPSASSVSDKPSSAVAPKRRVVTVVEPSKPPAADPFQDQK